MINYDVNAEEDQSYKNLIWSELEFIRKNENRIIKNAKILYNKKKHGSEEKIVKNCLDFSGVEKLCDEWIDKYKSNE